MRMTAFVIGGIIGAAAVVLWVRARQHPGAITSAIEQTGRMANRVMDSVRESLQEACAKAVDLAMSRVKSEAEAAGGSVRH